MEGCRSGKRQEKNVAARNGCPRRAASLNSLNGRPERPGWRRWPGWPHRHSGCLNFPSQQATPAQSCLPRLPVTYPSRGGSMAARLLRSRWCQTVASALALATAFWATATQAQDYPQRPVKLVVPYPPGGAADLTGRVLAQQLTVDLGQPVVVENRPGAAGNLGASAVAKEPPDGQTLLMGALTSHA